MCCELFLPLLHKLLEHDPYVIWGGWGNVVLLLNNTELTQKVDKSTTSPCKVSGVHHRGIPRTVYSIQKVATRSPFVFDGDQKGDRLNLPVPFLLRTDEILYFFLMDTRPLAERFRYRLGNRSQITATILVEGHIQIALYAVRQPRLLDEDIYILTFRDLKRSRIVDSKAIFVFTSHDSFPLSVHVHYCIIAPERPLQPCTSRIAFPFQGTGAFDVFQKSSTGSKGIL